MPSVRTVTLFGLEGNQLMSIFNKNLFAGKTVLVTGGGSGIGFAIAQYLGQLGANLLIAARDQERLLAAQDSLHALNINCQSYPLNVRDEDSVNEFFETLEKQNIIVDILVNNAGGQFTAPALEISSNGFRSVTELNLLGTFNMSKAFAKQRVDPQQPSCIINIVLCLDNGIPGMAHAAAARAGVVNLGKTLAWEWAPLGIRVNAIAPGTVRTAGLEQYDQQNLQKGVDKLLIKRMAEPEEVAQAVAYLASPAASYITGICLALDGGEHLTGASPQS